MNLPRLVGFYRAVLGFAVVGSIQPIGAEEMRLLGLRGGGRRQLLSIGRQTVAIDEFEMARRPYPFASDAASFWFQHLALVVADIAQAYARLRDVAPTSIGAPEQLPVSSGDVQAFKFRDPDWHPLELLQFPSSDTPPAWRDGIALPRQIALGVDHSAISVSDAETSSSFYEALGLKPGKRTLNAGPAQEHLDDLKNVEVAVTSLIPDERSPHLELLAYRVPRGDKEAPVRANDTSATRIVWRGDRPGLLHDPDGHLQQIDP